MSGSYGDLKVWQKSMELTLDAYRLTRRFPSKEVYGLTNQMRRAALSIASNIAEGKGRSSDRDFSLFLCHARGSLHELETQARIAQQLGYLQDEMAKHLGELTTETAKMLNGLIGSMRSTVQDKGHQRIETNRR
jgi:four helix bundle protein